MDKKKKRELIEWIVLIMVVSIIYFGGWHVQVVGKLQQVVLKTGFFQPSELENTKKASYNFTLTNVEGESIPFELFQNKVVFMNFWTTWCPPCIAEMPDIHSLYMESHDSIEFVMISMDQDKQKALDYIENNQYEFPVYFLETRLPKIYQVSSIPSTYLLSRGGDIVIENHGMAKYDSDRFKTLLAKLLKAQ